MGWTSRILVIVVMCLLAVGCSEIDNDHIPYDLTGYNVYVFGSEGSEFFAGFVSASYSERKAGLDRALFLARDTANAKHLGGSWSWIACTVTNESSCKTKVR